MTEDADGNIVEDIEDNERMAVFTNQADMSLLDMIAVQRIQFRFVEV
mgnify:CR=1 FL=1